MIPEILSVLPGDKIPLRTSNVRHHFRLAEISPAARPRVPACFALEPRLSRPGADRRGRSAGHCTGTQRRRRLRLPHRHPAARGRQHRRQPSLHRATAQVPPLAERRLPHHHCRRAAHRRLPPHRLLARRSARLRLPLHGRPRLRPPHDHRERALPIPAPRNANPPRLSAATSMAAASASTSAPATASAPPSSMAKSSSATKSPGIPPCSPTRNITTTASTIP